MTSIDPGAGGTVAVPHTLLAAAFAALDAADVAWCLLRGESTLADPSGDVDVLVDAARMADLDGVLATTAFRPDPSWGDGAHRQYVAGRGADAPPLRLDFQSSLTFGPSGAFVVNWLWSTLPTGAAPGCLARRRRVGAVSVLAPDDAFWCLLLHCVVDCREVAPRYALRLRALVGAAVPDGPMGTVVGAHCPPEWDAARVLDAARRERWTELVDLGTALPVQGPRHPLRSRLGALRLGLVRLTGTAARKVAGRRRETRPR